MEPYIWSLCSCAEEICKYCKDMKTIMSKYPILEWMYSPYASVPVYLYPLSGTDDEKTFLASLQELQQLFLITNHEKFKSIIGMAIIDHSFRNFKYITAHPMRYLLLHQLVKKFREVFNLPKPNYFDVWDNVLSHYK